MPRRAAGSNSPLAAEYEAAGAGLHIVPMARISTSHGAGQWPSYVAGWPVAVLRLVRLIRRLASTSCTATRCTRCTGGRRPRSPGRRTSGTRREIVVQSDRALRSSASSRSTSREGRVHVDSGRRPAHPAQHRGHRRDRRPGRVLDPELPGGSAPTPASPTTRRSSAAPAASTRGRASTSSSTPSRAPGRRADAAPRDRRRPGHRQGVARRQPRGTAATHCPTSTGSVPAPTSPELFADLDSSCCRPPSPSRTGCRRRGPGERRAGRDDRRRGAAPRDRRGGRAGERQRSCPRRRRRPRRRDPAVRRCHVHGMAALPCARCATPNPRAGGRDVPREAAGGGHDAH